MTHGVIVMKAKNKQQSKEMEIMKDKIFLSHLSQNLGSSIWGYCDSPPPLCSPLYENFVASQSSALFSHA